jgi:hypothetical protein
VHREQTLCELDGMPQWHLQHSRPDLDVIRRSGGDCQPYQGVRTWGPDAPDGVAKPDAIEADALNKAGSIHDVHNGRSAAIRLLEWQTYTKSHTIILP